MGVFWMMLMAFLVVLPCSQIGCFLILRRMALTGDAISHSVFPGVVIAFLCTGDLNSPWLIIGAALAGLCAVILIECIHRYTRIKQDAAIGIAFTALFALGIVLMQTLLSSKVDLDMECVLYGRLGLILESPTVALCGIAIPAPIISMGCVALLTQALIFFFYRVLALSSFDALLAASYGYKPVWVHYGLMTVLSFVVVASFQAVGAILVIALLILPGASAYLCVHRLPSMLALGALHALFSAIGGFYVHAWWQANMSSSVVVVGFCLLLMAWVFGPADGLLGKWLARRIEQ